MANRRQLIIKNIGTKTIVLSKKKSKENRFNVLLTPPDNFDKEKFRKDWDEAMKGSKQLPFTTGYDVIVNKIN